MRILVATSGFGGLTRRDVAKRQPWGHGQRGEGWWKRPRLRGASVAKESGAAGAAVAVAATARIAAAGAAAAKAAVTGRQRREPSPVTAQMCMARLKKSTKSADEARPAKKKH